MRPPTRRQIEILTFIAGCYPPPTLQEIGERFSFSCKGSYDHVNVLHRKGLLVRISDKQSARNLKLAPHLGFDGRRLYERKEINND